MGARANADRDSRHARREKPAVPPKEDRAASDPRRSAEDGITRPRRLRKARAAGRTLRADAFHRSSALIRARPAAPSRMPPPSMHRWGGPGPESRPNDAIGDVRGRRLAAGGRSIEAAMREAQCKRRRHRAPRADGAWKPSRVERVIGGAATATSRRPQSSWPARRVGGGTGAIDRVLPECRRAQSKEGGRRRPRSKTAPKRRANRGPGRCPGGKHKMQRRERRGNMPMGHHDEPATANPGPRRSRGPGGARVIRIPGLSPESEARTLGSAGRIGGPRRGRGPG